MELLIPHECNRCGVVDEAKFIYAGPHIKQICNGCGSYVKFYSKGHLPDVKEVKLRIWAITQDVSYINRAKAESGFLDNLHGVDAKINYWRLYLKLREMEAAHV